MFKDQQYRVYVGKLKRIFPVSALYWEVGKLVRIVYTDPSKIPVLSYSVRPTEENILMSFIGCYDKNKNELWEGDLVKFDPRNHRNFIVGVIKYDKQNTKFIVEQLTDVKDYYETQDELDELYKERHSPKNVDAFNFNSSINWYDIKFYDYDGATFTFEGLEKIGTIYQNNELLIKCQEQILEQFISS